MPRGNRSIIFAVVGWLILAAASPNQNSAAPHKAEPAKQAQEALPPPPPVVASEPAQPVQPAEYYRPCDDAQNESSSDLCAQWRTAKWTKIAAIFGILGFGGVLFALGLSIMSTRAAVRSNQIADETAKRQLRAYITLTVVRVMDVAPNKIPKFSLTVKNTGQSPAYKIHMTNLVTISEIGAEAYRFFGDQFPKAEFHADSSADIGPGESVFATNALARPISQAEFDGIMDGTFTLLIGGKMTYRDAFGGLRRVIFRWYLMPGHLTKKGRAGLSITRRNNRSN